MSYDFKVNESYYLTEDYCDLKVGTRIVIHDIVGANNSTSLVIRQFGDIDYILYMYECDFHLLSKEMVSTKTVSEVYPDSDYGYYDEDEYYDDMEIWEEDVLNNDYYKGLDAYKTPEQKESAKPATVIEKKVSVMLALLINKHYKEGLNIFKQEEIKLSSLGNKEAIQLVVDAALDTKDYELLKKLYS